MQSLMMDFGLQASVRSWTDSNSGKAEVLKHLRVWETMAGYSNLADQQTKDKILCEIEKLNLGLGVRITIPEQFSKQQSVRSVCGGFVCLLVLQTPVLPDHPPRDPPPQEPLFWTPLHRTPPSARPPPPRTPPQPYPPLRRTPSAGPPKISLFFFPLSRHHFRSFCLSLGVFSWNFWWCF